MTALASGKIAIATILLLAIIMAFSAYSIEPDLGLENHSLVLIEEKIIKVRDLAIAPGEVYTYAYSQGNETANATYLVMDATGCTLINMQGTEAFVCLDSKGNDPSGQNSTYNVPLMMFKPWMLAAKENWKWNVSSHIVFEGFEKQVEAVSYSVVRRDVFRGREAFVVKIRSSLGQEVWDWVDADKRILLREIGPGYELELIDGLAFDR